MHNFVQVLTDVCTPRAQTGDQKKLPTEGTVTAQGVLKSTFPLKSCSLRKVPVNNAECP